VVDSHHPSPLNQHVLSIRASARNDRTASAPPFAKAAFKRCPVSGACGPPHHWPPIVYLYRRCQLTTCGTNEFAY
jgi:hypothetical protein